MNKSCFIFYMKLVLIGFFIFIFFCGPPTKSGQVIETVQTNEKRLLTAIPRPALLSHSQNGVNKDAVKNIEIRMADSIFLYWDAPLDFPDSVDHYELFYRTDRDSGWTILKRNIQASKELNAVVRRNEVAALDSFFYFGVRSVAKNGVKSDFHFSSDTDAVPTGGWKLLWKH